MQKTYVLAAMPSCAAMEKIIAFWLETVCAAFSAEKKHSPLSGNLCETRNGAFVCMMLLGYSA